jgi:hypothetical protein
MRAALIAAVVAIGLAPHMPSQAQELVPSQAQEPVPQGPKVKITFEENGLVSLIANNATPQEIFAEWTRVGGSAFVNADRLPRTQVSLEYVSRPESEVLGSILRQAAGFFAGPRREGSTAKSMYESVFIQATSSPSGSGFASQPMQTQQPMITTAGAPDDEIAPVQAGRGATPPGPQPGPGPQPQPDVYRPAGSGVGPGASSVVVPVVPVVPVVSNPGNNPPPSTPPATPPGRGSGAAGS